jgi:hypothetical protein
MFLINSRFRNQEVQGQDPKEEEAGENPGGAALPQPAASRPVIVSLASTSGGPQPNVRGASTGPGPGSISSSLEVLPALEAPAEVSVASGEEETGRNKYRLKIQDLFADERCSPAILDFLWQRMWDERSGWIRMREMP